MAKKVALTKLEEFYVENNLGKNSEELAKDIGKDVSLITEYLHRVKPEGRINALLIRKKGAVVMTEGASMAGDESRKGYVSDESIQAAISKQDFEEVSRLQKIRQEQLKKTADLIRTKNETYIHYTGKAGK